MAGYPAYKQGMFTSRGYQQLTSTAASATIASLCSGSALPTGARRVLIVPSAAVRVSDNTDPSSSAGIPIAANQSFNYDLDGIATLKVYGAATLDCLFYS